MIATKKVRISDEDGNKIGKCLVDAWVLRPGKGGTKVKDQPGVNFLIEDPDGFNYEFCLTRTELLDLLGEVCAKYPYEDAPADEDCDCDALCVCDATELEDCSCDCVICAQSRREIGTLDDPFAEPYDAGGCGCDDCLAIPVSCGYPNCLFCEEDLLP